MNIKAMKIATKASGISLLIVFLMSCASPVTEQERTEFLSSYATLEKVNDSIFAFNSGKLGAYSTFIIDRPVMLFDRETSVQEKIFTDEELKDLAQYYLDRLKKAISEKEGYSLTDNPGEGVARLRIGITALDETVGALNLTIYTKITGAGLGGAAMEGELVDSITGEQLSAVIQWGNGSRILRAGFTKLGDAKLQINKWATRLRESLDDAHGV